MKKTKCKHTKECVLNVLLQKWHSTYGNVRLSSISSLPGHTVFLVLQLALNLWSWPDLFHVWNLSYFSKIKYHRHYQSGELRFCNWGFRSDWTYKAPSVCCKTSVQCGFCRCLKPWGRVASTHTHRSQWLSWLPLRLLSGQEQTKAGPYSRVVGSYCSAAQLSSCEGSRKRKWGISLVMAKELGWTLKVDQKKKNTPMNLTLSAGDIFMIRVSEIFL